MVAGGKARGKGLLQLPSSETTSSASPHKERKKEILNYEIPSHYAPYHIARHKQTMSSHDRKLHFVDESRPSRCARKFVFRCNEKFNPAGFGTGDN